MSDGLTFPIGPTDGETISYSFSHTGGEANNNEVTRTWSWNSSRKAWVSNYAGNFSNNNGGVGGIGFQGFQGFQGNTGSISNIIVNNTQYENIQSLQFFSDHSITHSSSNNILTITFGSELGSIFGSELGSISGNSKEPNVAKWEYTVYSADFDGSSLLVGPPSVTAKNLLEFQNTSTTAYGISVTGDQGITLSGFTGFAVTPVPNGTLVKLIYKGGNYFFSAPNPIDGVC